MADNYILPFLWMRGEAEEVIRKEIEKISECGIRSFCVEARPHKDFCGTLWWRDMDIVIDEAKKRNMTIWILDDKHFPTGYANGLIKDKYPERKKQYIGCTTCDITGSRHSRTLNVKRMLKPVIGFWQIGDPVNEEERAGNSLLSIIAVKAYEGDLFYEDTVDLTDTYNAETGMSEFTLPEGQWRIHCIYRTRTDGGDEDYINMLDKESAYTQIEGVYETHYRHYGQEFGKTIAGFFSDEPQLGNSHDPVGGHRLGLKNERLPWSNELEAMLRVRYGEQYVSMLPFLFESSFEKIKEPQMRYDYMDCVSKLYAENFSNAIGRWCAKHHVEYIGHVVEDNSTHSRLGMGDAHWFRAMEGQDMAGVDIIGGQYCFGAPTQMHSSMVESDGEFYQYTLGRLGASSGHLDPKKKGRTMCELFGAYGWSFGVRNMKYLLDHMFTQGVNYLVPHAFSMAEYPDPDCPPHFYARGHNPEFPWFAKLMKYADRVCSLMNGGRHVPSVAVLYDGEADWTGERMPMQKVLRKLSENQIESDIICTDMLRRPDRYNTRLKDGKLTINEVTFNALIVPYSRYLPAEIAKFAQMSGAFPVIFTDNFPKQFLKDENGYFSQEISLQTNVISVPLDDLVSDLVSSGLVQPALSPASDAISYYHYQKNNDIHMFFNESPDEAYSGTFAIGSEKTVCFYDAKNDEMQNAEIQNKDNGRTVLIELKPGESCILITGNCKEKKAAGFHLSYGQQLRECSKVLDLSKDWKVEKTTAVRYPDFDEAETVCELLPINDKNPDFSGIIRYTKEFKLDIVPDSAFFTADQVYDVMSLYVNERYAGYQLTPPFQLPVTGLLKEGNNTIRVEVATTPAREQQKFPHPPFDFSHETMDPTGMAGDIKLYYKTQGLYEKECTDVKSNIRK